MAVVSSLPRNPGRTVTGRYFGTGNGSRTTWNLAGLDSDVAYVAPAIYKSDWAGNQLLYTTSRTNLCLQSQTLDNAAWTVTRASISPNSTTAPDGTTTADTLIEDATAGNSHVVRINSAIATSSGSVYTNSIYLKAKERTWAAVSEETGVTATAWYNLGTGAVGSVTGTGSPTASITSVGNGWYRCTLSYTAGATARLRVYTSTNDTVLNYNGDGASGIYVWGGQLELGSTATSYIPTVAAAVSVTDYTLHATSGLVTFASAPAAGACLSYKQPWAPSSNAYMCFGTGNGTSTAFSLPYAPVTPLIYKNAVLQTLTTHYTVAPSGLVTFTAAPAANDVLTWTGSMGPMP